MMDPSQWSNYQQYSRLTPGGLSAPHSAFPLLDQTSLGSGLSLTHTLQPHAPLPQRALGTIPGVNYAHHSLHTSAMTQIIESMNPLAGGFNAQSLHKAGMNLSQNPLVFESVRSEQQVPVSSARFASAGSAVFSPTKSSLFEDQHKDPPHTYSSPSVVSQSPSLETGGKNWGLTNFMPAPANPFGSISSVDLSNTLSASVGHRSSQPPPAHSSASRHSAIQRNPYSADETPVRTARVEVQASSASQVHSLYNSMMGIGRQAPIQQMDFHGMGSHEIEDLSSGSQQNHMYAYSMGGSSSTNTASFAASQLAADINYDPVSPATPLSDNQAGDTAFPTTVSFADLSAIGASHHHKARHGPSGLSLPEHKEVASHLHPSLMMSQPTSQGRGSKSQQLGQVNSPHQHSPISVGSPQAPMSSMGSPQNVMPSSTVKTSAPPVQAMADSSTPKPKKPRNRKKPKEQIQKNMPPPQTTFSNNGSQQQTSFMNSSQAFGGGSYPNSQMIGSQYSSSASPNNLGNYQVLSSVGTQESPRHQQQQQQQTTDGPTLITLNPGARMSPLKGSTGSEAPMLSGAYQDEQDLQQGGQFDLQAFSTQPYMEQLVSGQSVRLIPGNVYSEAMHVAAGMPVFPGPYTYQTGEGSTIDEAAFSSLFDSGSKQETQVMESPVVAEIQQQQQQQQESSPSKQTATCTNPVDQDDELCNFARPPPEMPDKPAPKPPVGLQQPLLSVAEVKPPEIKPLEPPSTKKTGFQDSFMNFLMGKKQETLSSVTSATIGEKPQLPKYIPEPRRPPPAPRPEPTTSSAVSFSDDEEDSSVGVAVKQALTTLGQDSDSYDSDVKETGYSVQRGTKDLTVKITLQNTLKKQQSRRGRPPGSGRGRGRGDATKTKTTREPTPPPPRESIGRRAKDAVKKKKKYRESDSDEDVIDGSLARRGGSGSEYDSDKDPVWTPFDAQEPKRPPTFGFDTSAMFEAKPKKSKRKKKKHEGELSMSDSSTTPVKVARVDTPQRSIDDGVDSRLVDTLPTEEQHVDAVEDENFQVGRFLLEKKDLHNYESYPIWRLEQGRMMRKFEMTIDNGRILHKSVSTYSSWVPSMQAGYIPIRVTVVSNKSSGEVVEVVEEFRPKPPTDGSLEAHYEDDPLVDHFNVYLQIFLSQALEPSFLAAIRKSQEYFYLVPLEKIDRIIEQKLEEVDKIVQWKTNFRECMRMKPQMREINRPNLKQSCQACENSSPPTIKSVLFHGSAYDRFLLTDLPNSDSSSQEFLVGKHAAPFVTQYHNLHHFKYRLYQRCRAKVHMVRESNKTQNIKEESILDQCLQNRSWVLKIFEDFKTLLER